MELILMILVPFPLGYLVRNRLAAYVAYIAVHAYAFTFQSLALLIEWAGGSQAAFGPFPEARDQDLYAYGAVNLVIYAAGLGLVYLGHRVAGRRQARRTAEVRLDPVPG